MTENPDGTITVALNEMRDPEGLRADLLAAGVTADVSFLAPHTRCADSRFEGADPSYGSRGHTEARLRKGVERWRSFQAAQVVDVALEARRLAGQGRLTREALHARDRRRLSPAAACR
ncbi:hypothetical protein ACQPZZ_27785 [Microbispora sp. CA-135349]|uniref:hypothetical protein n=1 Tax=Microbispora sp. CA-135349 TaxID=3239953 RepID=UPI003D91CC41